MYIESHDRFDDVADFDPATGHLEEYSRAAGQSTDAVDVRGHYARLSGTLAVLYRLGTSIWLRIGSEARDLDALGSEVLWEHAGGQSVLTLLTHGEPVAAVEYQPGPGGQTELTTDPTPFAESEDWDFGLFVKNVLGDAGRRARIYGGVEPA